MSEVIRPFNTRMIVGLKPTICNIYADGDAVIIFFDASGTARDGKPSSICTRQGGQSIRFFDSVVFNEFCQPVHP